MNTHADKIRENKSQAVVNSSPKQQSNGDLTFQLVDNRPQVIAQRKFQKEINNSPRVRQLKSLQAMADFASKPALQMKGGVRSAPSVKSVLQRQVMVGDEEVDKDAINILGPLRLWLTRDGMSATVKNNKELKAATKTSAKATPYLTANLPGYISALLARYDTENRTFEDHGHLESQLIQDVKLSLLKLDYAVGIDHHGGQFSVANDGGRDKPLRIYRTTTRANWNEYLRSKSVGDLLRGHGGSLGQALDYFYKSKNGDENGPYYNNVIFELQFTQKAANAINYGIISAGGEGGGVQGGKLTGKNEQNDILGEAEVFSVNLSASRDHLISMTPKVRRVDEKEGEDSEFDRRLLKLSVKYGEYPPKNLTEIERIRLQELKP